MSQPRFRLHVIVTVVVLFIAAMIVVSRSAPVGAESTKRNPVVENATQKVQQGEQIFRFDTFGDQAFWGDTAKLHQAIEGAKLGGVGPGVSPATALAVGLKVDVEALPASLLAALKEGKVNLNDPATTLVLLKLTSVVGVTGFFNDQGTLRSIGIQCAFCHSTVDNSLAPGIGQRLDGWPNRDLNVGAVVSLAPNLTPFTDLLGVDANTVKSVLATWGPGCYDAELNKDGKGPAPRRETGLHADPAGVRAGRCQLAYVDRLWLRALLECLCWGDSDAWFRHLLRRQTQ